MPSKETPIVLFTPYFSAKTPERQGELDACIERNLACQEINKIILLIDDKRIPPVSDSRLEIINVTDRPTYQMWARLSDTHAKGAITVLANSDIYLDDSIRELRETLAVPNRFVALTRLDKNGDRLIPHPNPRWSQDAWAYSAVAPLPRSVLAALDIPLGVPRCDNKVAYVFAIHGWGVCNPCLFVRSVHVHETNQRAYCKKTDQTVLGGVAYVHPSASIDTPSIIDIDIWARGTDAIKNVTLNRSLDLWMKEHLAPNFAESPVSLQVQHDAQGKFSAGTQADFGAITETDALAKVSIATSLHPLGNHYIKRALTVGRVVWADPLMRFRILEHQGRWYAHDTLQPNPLRALPDPPLQAGETLPADVLLAAFVPAVLNTAPLIVRDRPATTDDCHFWQYPAATERQAWQNHIGIQYGANIDVPMRTVHTYLGLPWATYIDKKHLPDEVTRLFVPRLRGLHRLVQSLGWTLRVHTVCQQIYWRRLIDTFQQLGVTDLHLSHATTDIDPAREGWQLRIHSWPLFAPNIEVPERRTGLTIGKPIEEKRYLASFVGAHMPHYRSDVRVRLFEAAKASGRGDILVDLGNEWHFNKVVYKEQVQHKPLAEDENAAMLRTTQRYNEVLSDSVFSLCPEGAGPNTLRLWESLAVGSIPVIFAPQWVAPKSPLGAPLFEECAISLNTPFDTELAKWLSDIPKSKVGKMQRNCIALYEQMRHMAAFCKWQCDSNLSDSKLPL